MRENDFVAARKIGILNLNFKNVFLLLGNVIKYLLIGGIYSLSF